MQRSPKVIVANIYIGSVLQYQFRANNIVLHAALAYACGREGSTTQHETSVLHAKGEGTSVHAQGLSKQTGQRLLNDARCKEGSTATHKVQQTGSVGFYRSVGAGQPAVQYHLHCGKREEKGKRRRSKEYTAISSVSIRPRVPLVPTFLVVAVQNCVTYNLSGTKRYPPSALPPPPPSRPAGRLLPLSPLVALQLFATHHSGALLALLMCPRGVFHVHT